MHASTMILSVLATMAAFAFGDTTVTADSSSAAASSVGKARVVNMCPFSVSLWSVGGSVSGPYTIGASGGYYAETFSKDPITGGRALKVTVEPNGLYSGAPQTIFAYSLDEGSGKVWYDLSDVFGDAFLGRKLVERSENPNCPAIVWPAGSPPAGSQVKVCGANKDVQLTLCAA